MNFWVENVGEIDHNFDVDQFRSKGNCNGKGNGKIRMFKTCWKGNKSNGRCKCKSCRN